MDRTTELFFGTPLGGTLVEVLKEDVGKAQAAPLPAEISWGVDMQRQTDPIAQLVPVVLPKQWSYQVSTSFSQQ